MSEPRIAPRDLSIAPPEVVAAGVNHEQRDHARLTNMKRTLLHSPLAFDALMTWYPLRDRVQAFLGERATVIFAHAISERTDCLICSTYFRRNLIDWGEDPDSLQLSPEEEALVEFGRALTVHPHEIPDQVYARVAQNRSPEEMVALVTFGAIMLATNVFNNVVQVPLDGYLEPYRRGASRGTV
jgi:hypothetical protein